MSFSPVPSPFYPDDCTSPEESRKTRTPVTPVEVEDLPDLIDFDSLECNLNDYDELAEGLLQCSQKSEEGQQQMTKQPYFQDLLASDDIGLDQMMQPSFTELKLPPEHTQDDGFVANEEITLSTAIMAAEAYGTKTPLIKEELRYKIQNNRRKQGLPNLQPEYKKENDSEVLTEADKIRRERRKASNRRAARKCREKKRQASVQVEQEFHLLKEENERLKKRVKKLEDDKQKFVQSYKSHLAQCPLQQRASSTSTQHSLSASCNNQFYM